MDADEIAQTVLAVAVDHPMWIGDDGQPLDYLPEREARIGDFVHEVAQVLAPLVEQAIVAAEQVGREDNAEHDQCYVYGSCALEAKLEQARQKGAREALRAAADELDAMPSYRLPFLYGHERDHADGRDVECERIADWLRDRAERAATPGSWRRCDERP